MTAATNRVEDISLPAQQGLTNHWCRGCGINLHIKSQPGHTEIGSRVGSADPHDDLTEVLGRLRRIRLRADSGYAPAGTAEYSGCQADSKNFRDSAELIFYHSRTGREIPQALFPGGTTGHDGAHKIQAHSVHDSQQVPNGCSRERTPAPRPYDANSYDDFPQGGATTLLEDPGIQKQDDCIRDHDGQQRRGAEAPLRLLEHAPAHQDPGVSHRKDTKKRHGIKHECVEAVPQFRQSWRVAAASRRRGRWRAFRRFRGLQSGLLQQMLSRRNEPTARGTTLALRFDWLVTMRAFHSFLGHTTNP